MTVPLRLLEKIERNRGSLSRAEFVESCVDSLLEQGTASDSAAQQMDRRVPAEGHEEEGPVSRREFEEFKQETKNLQQPYIDPLTFTQESFSRASRDEQKRFRQRVSKLPEGGRQSTIRVFLANSQMVFREGMHFILECEEDVAVVGEGRSIEETLTFLQREAVDVVVLDGDMMDGVSPITEAFVSMGFVFVGNSHPGQDRLGAGNRVFLTRGMDPAELADAVRKVALDNSRASAQDDMEGIEEVKHSRRESLLSLVE